MGRMNRTQRAGLMVNQDCDLGLDMHSTYEQS